MPKTINYISRKRLPTYHSIEELFLCVAAAVKKNRPTHWESLNYSGASPWVLLRNLGRVTKTSSGLYHITGDVHYMALAYRSRAILTIHDVGSAFTGSWLKRFYMRLFWFWLPALFVKKITVISEFTKHELVRIIPLFASKIHVIYNPVHSKLQPCVQPFKTLPEILLLGTKANKNLERSLQALQYINCTVVIVGQLTDAQKQFIINLGISYTNHVNLSFDAIISCYESCDILCFPSTYEGFGMPIIEAQTVGRVVLTSHHGAMKEVAGDGAHLVNPNSVAAIRAGIERVISDTNYRDLLIARGFANAERFSLKHTVTQYEALYGEM